MKRSELKKVIHQEVMKEFSKEEITENDFDFSEENNDEVPEEYQEFDAFEFHGSAKDAAKEDIEKEGGSFEDIGKSKFEKGKTEKDFANDLSTTNLRLPSEEKEIEKIQKDLDKNKDQNKSLKDLGTKMNGPTISLNEDDDNYMTPQNLRNIESDAKYLLTKIDSKSNIDDWVEDKISKVSENMRSISYFYKGKEKESNESLNESKRNKKLIGIITEEYDFDTTSLYKFLKDALYQLEGKDYAETAQILEEELNKTFKIIKK